MLLLWNPTTASSVSQYLEGYEFIQVVGTGGMGSVYLARQTRLNRLVAIKQVRGAWNGDPRTLERFRREARALARMNHPNVVVIYNLEATSRELYMVQEYVYGPTLEEILDNGRLSTGQALRVIGELAAALDYAAKQGIIHRDLKPGNVFVTTNGSCKLGDFGLVKVIGADSNLLTQDGTILGTASYMSPEQAAGKPEIDQRTDVYSLAVVAYELLVGRLPFLGVTGNIMSIVEAHISTPPPPPSQIAPGFPHKAEEVLLSGLAKDPGRRPKSAGVFWVRLAAAAEQAWPTWPADSDLSAIATKAAPFPPAIAHQDGPPASTPDTAAGQQLPPPPLGAGAPMDDTKDTLASNAVAAEQTLALPGQSDQTLAQGPSSGDETMSTSAPAIGETPAQSPHSVLPDTPIGSSGFVPPRTAGTPAPREIPVPPVRVPVYKPSKPKSRRRPHRAFLPLLLVVALVAMAYFLLNRNGPPPVAVMGAEAVVSPQVGHCPSATYVFTGRIFTKGGAGNITYQWVQPDGLLGQETVQNVTSGQTIVSVRLQFTFKGNGSTMGAAHLKVLKPSALESTPASVQYLCP
jgi:eukaryotic-like serine/threonine-protein kinase